MNDTEEYFEKCDQTVLLIKKLNGYSAYAMSSKFWRAMICIFKHPDFEYERWIKNIQTFNTKLTAKSKLKDYIDVLLEIYNWRTKKIISYSEISS